MISKAEFKRLRAGDRVVWRERMVRTIQQGPADAKWDIEIRNAGSVTFAIHNRSWTGRAYTVYGYNDVRDKITRVLPRRARSLMSAAELARLKECRFQVRRELRRELREQAALNERMSFWHKPGPCRAMQRFVRLAPAVR